MPSRQDLAAVELGGGERPDRGVRASVASATTRTASAVEVAATARRARQRLGQEAPALAQRLGMRDDGLDVVQRDARRARSARGEIGSTSSPTIRTRAPASSSASASSVALTPPSSEFSIGTSAASTVPAPAARIVSRSVGQRDGLDLGVARDVRGGQQRGMGERARGPEVAEPHGSRGGSGGGSPASATRTASISSGDSGYSGSPPTTCLT